jgi:hypothetical protein
MAGRELHGLDHARGWLEVLRGGACEGGKCRDISKAKVDRCTGHCRQENLPTSGSASGSR